MASAPGRPIARSSRSLGRDAPRSVLPRWPPLRIASTLPQLGEISCSESSHVPRPIRTREADPSKFVDCQSLRLSTAFISSLSPRRDHILWPNTPVPCPFLLSPPLPPPLPPPSPPPPHPP